MFRKKERKKITLECGAGFAKAVIMSFNELVLSEVRSNPIEVDRIFTLWVNQFHTELTPLTVGHSYDIVKRPSIAERKKNQKNGGCTKISWLLPLPVFEQRPAAVFGFTIETRRFKGESLHF